jgi:Cation transport ATPase
LSIIKAISTTKGVPIIFVPLAFIICVSMLKDIVEDYKRHLSDSEENNRKTRVLRNGQFVDCKWRDLRVGNIILVRVIFACVTLQVREDEYFPADVLILKSGGKKGAVYIETKNLDGETNLKFKTAHKDIADDFLTDEMVKFLTHWLIDLD